MGRRRERGAVRCAGFGGSGTIEDMIGSSPSDGVVEVLGIYNADGGWRGEVVYVLGAVLRRTHCGLCDVTHSPVRRKATWDRMVRQLGIPVRLAHRNELTADEQSAVQGLQLPMVIGRMQDDRWRPLLSAARLDQLDGSVEAFDRALRAALEPAVP